MTLKLLTLGAASILVNEQSLDAQFGVKARALLLYTALQSKPVSRELLAAMFWKDSLLLQLVESLERPPEKP